MSKIDFTLQKYHFRCKKGVGNKGYFPKAQNMYFWGMKQIILSFLVLVMMACQGGAQSGKTIPAAEFMKQLAATRNEYLLDVRTPGEYNEEHLNNAVNIDYNSADFEAQIKKLEKSRPVFLYCLSGGRSGSAVSVLAANGFKEIYNMQGGIMQWRAAKFPTNLNNSSAAATPSWKGMSQAEYDAITQSTVPVLIDFNATWCGPCKKLKPILDEIATEYAGKVKIVAIDVDQNKSLADAMQIRSIPLLIYYKNGKVAMNFEGYTEKKTLIKEMGLNK
jgi:thioredoxin 1